MLQEQELSFGRVNFPAHMAEITTTETPEIVPKGNGATQNPVIARSCGFKSLRRHQFREVESHFTTVGRGRILAA
jgi:hypothetical protein